MTRIATHERHIRCTHPGCAVIVRTRAGNVARLMCALHRKQRRAEWFHDREKRGFQRVNRKDSGLGNLRAIPCDHGFGKCRTCARVRQVLFGGRCEMCRMFDERDSDS